MYVSFSFLVLKPFRLNLFQMNPFFPDIALYQWDEVFFFLRYFLLPESEVSMFSRCKYYIITYTLEQKLQKVKIQCSVIVLVKFDQLYAREQSRVHNLKLAVFQFLFVHSIVSN